MNNNLINPANTFTPLLPRKGAGVSGEFIGRVI